MHRLQDQRPVYAGLAGKDRRIVLKALEVLRRSVRAASFGSPQEVKSYLTVKYADLPHEVFGVIWLDSQHRLLREEVLFRGTLSQTSVYPRELVKRGLAMNAGACLLFHNHPSGVAEPSTADQLLTAKCKEVLGLVDIRVLDHIVCGSAGATSFAERGLL